MPGAEPFSAKGGPAGVLVVHGFTGNPQSMRPLAEAFAAAGFTVELPLLPGHGTSLDDIIATGWDDWSGAGEAACQELAAARSTVVVDGPGARVMLERSYHVATLDYDKGIIEARAVAFARQVSDL